MTTILLTGVLSFIIAVYFFRRLDRHFNMKYGSSNKSARTDPGNSGHYRIVFRGGGQAGVRTDGTTERESFLHDN